MIVNLEMDLSKLYNADLSEMYKNSLEGNGEAELWKDHLQKELDIQN